MDNKSINIKDSSKKQTVIMFSILSLLLLLPREMSIEGLLELLGALTAHIFFGVIIGNIYFLLKRSQRTKWQRFKVIVFLSLAFYITKLLSSLL